MTARHRKLWLGFFIALLIVVLALFAYVWQPAIDPIEAPPTNFTEEQLLQGRNVAAAGACVVCHTAPDGQPNAGGLAMDTPFGTVYSTNITPDPETGIGKWSFEAFDRSMRRGVARDGTYHYPAFPYTHFTHLTDEDMEALYAHLMSEPPVKSTPPETDLPFPFNIRPLMAGWNLLFLDRDRLEPVPEESDVWNRGRYLTLGAGHCAACHSPRNALGAEKGGDSFMAGGKAQGWIAPALNMDSPAPVPWTEQALFDYLRHGFAEAHGAAGGSMAPVVREGTSQIAEADTRAMAVYLASLAGNKDAQSVSAIESEKAEQAQASFTPAVSDGARLFSSACLSCHHAGEGPPVFGVRSELWFSTSLHLDEPDNVVRYVLDGVQDPASPDLGYMPGFRHSLNDEQIATVVNYMRTSFAQKPEWPNLPETVHRIRTQASGEGS